MSDVIANFVFLIISLGLAIAGAVVGAWLQHRSWVQQNWDKLRLDRKASALAVVQRASELFDRRLYRQRRLLWAVRGRDPKQIETELEEYRAAVFAWMDNLGRTKAELWASFDRWTATRLETELHDPLAEIGRRIERALLTERGTTLSAEERDLNRLGRSGYEFMQRLLERIQDEDLEGLVGRYRLTLNNWENLSISFLLARLFGLANSR